MAEEQDRLDDLSTLAESLAALVPRGDRLQRQRDRLMFLAGQAAAGADEATPLRLASADRIENSPARRWAWPLAFGGMSAVAAGLLLALLARPPRGVERIVEVRPAEVDAAVAAPAVSETAASNRSAPDNAAPPARLEQALIGARSARRASWQPAGWLALLDAMFNRGAKAESLPADDDLHWRAGALASGVDVPLDSYAMSFTETSSAGWSPADHEATTGATSVSGRRERAGIRSAHAARTDRRLLAPSGGRFAAT